MQTSAFLKKITRVKIRRAKTFSSSTIFLILFYSWQLRKRIQKTVQLEKIFGPSYFDPTLKGRKILDPFKEEVIKINWFHERWGKNLTMKTTWLQNKTTKLSYSWINFYALRPKHPC